MSCDPAMRLQDLQLFIILLSGLFFQSKNKKMLREAKSQIFCHHCFPDAANPLKKPRQDYRHHHLHLVKITEHLHPQNSLFVQPFQDEFHAQ